MSLVIHSESCGVLRLVRPRGRLDTETSADLELFAHDRINGGDSHFIVDLSAVDYVSSAGLRVLLMMAKSLDGEARSLRLSGLGQHVREVFDISGFTQLFQMFPTMEQAIRAHPMAPQDGALISAVLAQLGVSDSDQRPAEQGLAELAARLLGAEPRREPHAGARPAQPQSTATASSPAPGAAKPSDAPQGWLRRLWKRLTGR